MATLTKAIQIATFAHDGQTDKSGRPFILHPIRVMSAMKTDEERMVAVLHDVVEDSDFTLDKLRIAGFSEKIVKAVDLLSRTKDVSYFEYIRRLRDSKDHLAIRVKLADIRDNSDKRRKFGTESEIASLLKRYDKALDILAEKAS